MPFTKSLVLLINYAFYQISCLLINYAFYQISCLTGREGGTGFLVSDDWKFTQLNSCSAPYGQNVSTFVSKECGSDAGCQMS